MSEPQFFGADSEEDDEEASVHSAISNESDFEEDDDEYLALELVHHLPPDKANKLMKSMRAKETAVQDLLQRNRRLLGSCEKLDNENQTLSERLKDAEEAATKAPPPPEAEASSKPASTNVDMSFWELQEQSKDKKIARLAEENRQLVFQVKRLDEGCRQLDEALVQTRNELKKSQKQGRAAAENGSSSAPPSKQPAKSADMIDEEERLFREMQGDGSGAENLEVLKLQKRYSETTARLQAVLKALIQEDRKRVERWNSDVSAVLLAVDGLEGRMKSTKKGSKETKGADKSKASSQGGACHSAEQIREVSSQLVDDFDTLRAKLETVEKTQLSLEQTARGLQDGAESAAAAADFDSSLEDAEKEADWIREHNATWAERVQTLNLEPTTALLQSTESTVRNLLGTVPPGLIPGQVESCLQETAQQIHVLASTLSGQARVVADLKAESSTFGRRLQNLQAAHKAHREESRKRLGEELRNAACAFEAPLQQMRYSLRQQGEAFSKAKSRVADTLEALAAEQQRSAGKDSGGSETAGGAVSSTAAAPLADCMAELKEVRGMGKALVASLEEGGRSTEKRIEQVLAALEGDKEAATGRTAPEASKEGGAEKSKKKGKKKSGGASGGAAAAAPPAPAKQTSAPSEANLKETMREKKPAEKAVGASPGGGAGYPAKDEEKQEREKRDKAPTSGPELLQQLQTLRSDAEALEARMAQRMQSRVDQEEEEPREEKVVAAAAAARRRKNRFA
eukprot:TRINITY_DN21894_c0_g1_i1.p1 TRINITY_DN21894_c0_g1~~TRINITY_DN21894_c0_g1_i1.p1  ORF type:complete len:742 (-),score=316.53 TRINITY_DN21894_c0_g1_i1:46-2271(-)